MKAREWGVEGGVNVKKRKTDVICPIPNPEYPSGL